MAFFNYDAKLVFVTGSTKGIGAKCNEVFYRAGADVVVAGRGAGDVAASAAALAAAVPARNGGGILQAAFDLGTAAGCDACLAWLETLGRPVDVLVNNLGIFEVRPFAEITDEEWTRFFEVNVMSGVRLCRALLPKMLARGSGSIVFVSSEAALATKPFMMHYSMTKTAQLSLARSLLRSAASQRDLGLAQRQRVLGEVRRELGLGLVARHGAALLGLLLQVLGLVVAGVSCAFTSATAAPSRPWPRRPPPRGRRLGLPLGDVASLVGRGLGGLGGADGLVDGGLRLVEHGFCAVRSPPGCRPAAR
jgi:NADP-dependent 3-hydroxy acid dehydrogenase YdfG